MQALRVSWQSLLCEWQIPQRLKAHILQGREDPLFSPVEVTRLREVASSWARNQGAAPFCWDVPPHQPYCLSALGQLSTMARDIDTTLFPSLLEGVPAGVDHSIPTSNCFRPNGLNEGPVEPDFAFCDTHWLGAHQDPETLWTLVQQEVADGFVEQLPSLEEARAKWGDRLALMKLNVVRSPGKNPRLVVDPAPTQRAKYLNGSYFLPWRMFVPACRCPLALMTFTASAWMCGQRTKEYAYGKMIEACSLL